MKPLIDIKETGSFKNDSVKIIHVEFEELELELMTFGGIIKSLKVPDRNGEMSNIVIGYNDVQSYFNDTFYIGATIGRFANRINKGCFNLDGKDYCLPVNNGKHHLHGGPGGFHKKNWALDTASSEDGLARILLSYKSMDAEEGYPGTLSSEAEFEVRQNELSIIFKAFTQKPTVVNLTHHGYFNLSGDPFSKIGDHRIMIQSEKYLVVDDENIPTGKVKNVSNTPFDFRRTKKINDMLKLRDPEGLRGFDHCYILHDNGNGPDGIVIHENTGRKMELFTTYPGLQFYSGEHLGDPFSERMGLCLEPQFFPDAPNKPHFPSTILRPGEIYRQKITYKFSNL